VRNIEVGSKVAHTAEANWGPRSDARWAATPWQESRWCSRAEAQASAAVLERRMSSAHLAVWSIIVNA
jgi:hypothetical protein